jgi:hypothetical protein
MAAAQPRMMNVTTAESVPSPRPLPLRGTEVPGGGGIVSLRDVHVIDNIAEDNPDHAASFAAELRARAAGLRENPQAYRKGKATGFTEPNIAFIELELNIDQPCSTHSKRHAYCQRHP